MKSSLKHSLTLLLALGFLIAVISAQADDSLSTEEPTVDVVVSETPLPTEIPTDVPVFTPTEAPTEVPPLPTSEPTVESQPMVEVEAPSDIDPTPAPSVLPLAFSANFDAAYPPELSAADGWLDVSVTDGKALQSNGQTASVVYQAATFLDGDVEASLFLNAGSGSVLLSDYTASLNAEGLLTLMRGDAVLGSFQAASTIGTWAVLRLSVVGISVQVSLDGVSVITITDAAPALEGKAGFAAIEGATLRIDNFAVYGTPAMVLPLPTPTDAAPVIPTVISAPITPTTTVPEPLPGLPLPQVGETITLVGSSNQTGTVTFTWNDLSDELRYRLVTSPDGLNWYLESIQNFDVTTYSMANLNCSDVVLMKVYGVLSDTPDTFIASNVAAGSRACPIETFAAYTPLNNMVSSNNSPTLTWTSVENTTAYEVEVSTSSAFTSLVAGYPQDVDGIQYTVPALPDGVYYWRVRVKAPQTSAFTTPRKFTVEPPKTPTGLGASIGNPDTVSLGWHDVPSADGYVVEQSVDNTTWTQTAVLPRWNYAYTITGLSCSYLVNVRVSSYNNSITRKSSSVSAFGRTELCPITINGPLNGASFGNTNPTFSWEPVVNTTDYSIDISLVSTFATHVTGYPKTVVGTSFTTDTLSNGTYYWRVSLRSPVSGSTTSGQSFAVTDRPTPLIPASFTASSDLVDRVRLTWSNVAGEGGYILEQSADNTAWTSLATLPADTITYDVTTLTSCGLSPYYRIRTLSALDANLVFAPGASARGTVKCPALLNPTNNLITQNNVVQFLWDKLPNILAYEIDFSTSSTFTTHLPGYPRIIDQTGQGNTFSYYHWADALPNADIYWRVRPMTPTQGFYGPVYKLTVATYLNFIPDVPVPLTPMSVIPVRTPSPTFTWQVVPFGIEYEIQVDDDPSFRSPNTKGIADYNKTTYTTPYALDQGIQYWRIRSLYWEYWNGTSAPKAYSPWSVPLQFTINPALTPADNTVIAPIGSALTARVVFTWTGPASSLYTVQVNPDPTFPIGFNLTCVSNVAAVKTCSVLNLPFGTYYWRILRNDETPIGAPVYNRFSVSPAAPRAVTLTSPLNNASLQSDKRPAVKLDWSWGTVAAPVGGPFTYEVQVSPSKLFDLELADSDTGLTDPTLTTVDLADGTYYWRVRAVNTHGVPGAWTTPFGFIVDSVPPGAPSLLLPAANALVPTARPTFTWAAVPGASRYVVEVNETCDGVTPLHLSTDIVGKTSYVMPTTAAALPQGPMVVCVTAYDLSGNVSLASEARAFTVFLGTTPTANAFVPATTKPKFVWTAVTGATGYTLQVDTDTDWNDGDGSTFTLGPVTTYTMTSTLTAGTYYWRVLPTGGTTTENVYRTLYIGVLPAGPALINPAPNAAFNGPVSLSWSAATAPLGTTITDYQIEVAKTSTFLPVLYTNTIDATQPLEDVFTPALNQNRVTHYWRVRGLVDGTPITNWVSRTFVVDNVAPAVPVVSAPLVNALVNTVRPAISWKPVVGATGYRVAIEDTVTHMDVVTEQLITGTTLVLQANLPQSELVLRVRAEDGLNESGWASVNFRVRLGTLPAQNAVVTSNRPAFTWLAVPGATSYTLQVDDDSQFENDGDVFQTINLGSVLTYTLSAAEALPLNINRAYFWRVRANNLAYPSSTASRTFYYATAVALKPLNPRTLSNGVPATVFNQTIYDMYGVSFAWTDLAVLLTPSLYQVEVSTAAAFPAVGTVQHTSSNSPLTLTSLQLTDGVKYWRVRAVYSGDLTSYGPWSDVKSFTLDQVAPLPPMSPASLFSVSNTNRPVFTWAAVPGAARYVLTVGTVIDHMVVTGTTYTLPTTVAPLTQNNDEGYEWFVQAEDAAGNRSASSLTRTMTVFVGLAPKAAQFINNPSPVFTWTGVTGTGAAGWIVQVARDQEMTNIVYTSQPQLATAKTFTLPTSLPAGRYFWRVYRVGESLTDLLGQAFYVLTSVADATSIPAYPPNGSTVNAAMLAGGLYMEGTDVSVSAPALLFTGHYLIEIGTTAAFDSSSLVGALIVLNGPYGVAENLPLVDGKTYYWRVRGLFGPLELGPDPVFEDFMHLDLGPVGGVYTFKVDKTAPSVPAPKTPVANARLVTRTPTFTWAASTGTPSSYRLEIANDEAFTSKRYTLTSTTATFVLPVYASLPNGTFYWRVSARDAAGNYSAPSAVRSLTIAVP